MTFKKLTYSFTRTVSSSVVGAIRLYQKTRILRAPSCRFYPSCSQYMLEGIQRFGLMHGSLLGLGRICRCHPLNAGGVDEVPECYPPVFAPAALNVAQSGTSSDSGFKGFVARWKNRSNESLRGNR